MELKPLLKKYWFFLVLIFVLLVFLLNTYRIAGIRHITDNGENCLIENNSACKTCYHAWRECGCLGIITSGESYPPSYNCIGIKLCREINITNCN